MIDLQDSQWHLFWLFEVAILSLPLFIAIFLLPPNGHLSLHQAAVLGVIVLVLTILNALIIRPKLSVLHRKRF